ncbi:hypothetical protein EV401DRAFT_1922753 [Pisolithus croceorrhizus]|nr:hypothetical protein EV401DRAFT_1922753 [Pisolithus croceorrhizus]
MLAARTLLHRRLLVRSANWNVLVSAFCGLDMTHVTSDRLHCSHLWTRWTGRWTGNARDMNSTCFIYLARINEWKSKAFGVNFF